MGKGGCRLVKAQEGVSAPTHHEERGRHTFLIAYRMPKERAKRLG